MTGDAPTTGTCVSCGTPSVCVEPWPVDLVPLPPNVVDGMICDECHSALVRYVDVVQPVIEEPAPVEPPLVDDGTDPEVDS